MRKKLKPTEKYPRIIWYQEKREPMTEQQEWIYYNMFIEQAIQMLEKTHKKSSHDSKKKMAKEIADSKIIAEKERPTVLRKKVVNTLLEHEAAKEMIESSPAFLKWYEMEK